VERKQAELRLEKSRKLVRGKFKCPNCHELGHRKDSPKCPLNGSKKRQVLIESVTNVKANLLILFSRKRKPRKNTTKGWFPKEAPTYDPTENVCASSPPREDVGASSAPHEDVATSSPPSPPRILKKAVHKMTP
jgi:hypothetical protein